MASALLLLCFTHAVFGVSAQDLARPTLTAHPSVITETESVTLNCRPPPLRTSVPVSRCHFYTTDGQNWENPKCLQFVRGSDLLREKQKPPAQVQVKCYYVVHWGQAVSSSDHSDPTPVTVHVQNMKPEISLHADDTEVIISCSPPPSATASKCHLYFGESTQPHSTVNSRKKSVLCQFYVSKMDFVTNFHKLQRKVFSCDYTLVTGPLSLSPRSEQKDLTVVMRKYYSDLLHVTSAPSDPEMTTDPQHETGSDSEPVLPVHTTTPRLPVTSAPSDPVKTTNPQHETIHTTASRLPVTSAPSDPVKTTNPQQGTDSAEKVKITLWVILGVCGVLLLGGILRSAFIFTKCRNAKHNNKSSRFKAVEYLNTQDQTVEPRAHMVVNDDNFYSVITSVPSAHCSKGSAEVVDNQSKDEDESEIYHLYDTIQDEPGSATVENVLYSSL